MFGTVEDDRMSRNEVDVASQGRQNDVGST